MRRFAPSIAAAVISSLLVLCSTPGALAFAPLALSGSPKNVVEFKMQRHDEMSREAAKLVATSLLTATLLLAPPVFAASTPPSMVAPSLPTTSKTLVTSSNKASAAAVPAEKRQIDDAVTALKDASSKLVIIKQDLATAKGASQKACLIVDQAEAKAKTAKDELAKLKAKKVDDAKIGMFSL